MFQGPKVIPRQDLHFLTSKSDVPGIYTSDAPAYLPEDFHRDAALHGVEDEIAPLPRCLAINTTSDQYAPGDNMFAGTWLEVVPRDIREMIRCYWSSGLLPDSYRLAGAIAQIPALEQWYPNMMLTWEDGSRYRRGTDRSPESRSAQDRVREQTIDRTCWLGGAAARIVHDTKSIEIHYNTRKIKLPVDPNIIKMNCVSFGDSLGTIIIRAQVEQPTELSWSRTFLQYDRYLTTHHTFYLITDPLESATWHEQRFDPYSDVPSMSMQQGNSLRCRYTFESNVVTEYFGATPTRVACVPYHPHQPDTVPRAIDAAGNILVMVGVKDALSYSGGTLARLQPVWIPYELGIIPTEPPIITPYPNLPSEGNYIYSPDGTLYAVFNRFTRMFLRGAAPPYDPRDSHRIGFAYSVLPATAACSGSITRLMIPAACSGTITCFLPTINTPFDSRPQQRCAPPPCSSTTA